MTSREIVSRAIEFTRPARLPLLFASLGFSDTHWVGVGRPAGWTPVAPNADEYGCLWETPPEESGIVNMGQPKGHPLRSLDALDEISWPDVTEETRYEAMRPHLEQAGDKYVTAGWGFVFFERMHFLYGMPELLAAMYEEPAKVHALAERVIEIPIRVAQELGKRFRGRIHGFTMTDDWGTQAAAFVSVPMWREFFKDGYTRLFRAIHDAGMHVWMHSCGHVNDIIEEWIACGVDVLDLQQPRNLGIEEIGRRYRGRVCFSSLCDIQTTLPFGADEEVREEARLLLEHWSTPEGGFILSDYGDGRAIGVPLARKRVMLEAFIKLAAPDFVIPEQEVS